MLPSLDIISSSSSGNAYVLSYGDERLLLECGEKAERALQTFMFDLPGVCGALVSHRHGDHAKYIQTFQRYGINVFSSSDVANKYKGVNVLAAKKRYKIGRFVVMPIEVPHGDCLNFAYIIDLPDDAGRLLFATDLSSFPYVVPDVNFMMIECNYSESIYVERLCENEFVRSNSKTHLELEDCISAIQSIRSASLSLRQVVLLHLSARLSDAVAFTQRVKDEFADIECVVADKGVKLVLPAAG